jgi:protease-4
MSDIVPITKKPNPLAIVLTLSAAFFVLLLIVSGGVYLFESSRSGKGGKSESSGFLGGGGQVGVLEVNGVIMDSKKTLKRLEKFEDDPSVKSIVLRINSPGGAVAPSQEIYEALKASKKPVIASMSSVAASGGYYIAMGAKKVYANPGTITGSIGVIMEFINLSKLYEWAKVQRYSIKTGKFKDVGAEYKAMEPEDRALLQAMVDDVLLQFKKAVAAGRKLPLDEVTRIADGRIFSGSQAKAAKLVDELGTLQDAIDEAGREGKIEGRPKVVYPEKSQRSKLLQLLTDDGGDSDEAASGKAGWIGLLGRVLGVAAGPLAEVGPDAATVNPGIYWLWKGAR